jgi:REP element-mobilizing transposase RayT
MKPSAIGEIVNQCWVLLSDDFANVGLDAFQIMPNHFHGIVVLFGPDRRDLIGRDLINQIPAGISPNPTDNQIPTGLDESRFGPVPGWQQMKNPKQTLGKIIRHFKAKATRQIHEAGCADFQWQQRFHDRIIRGEDELNRIRAYIQSNPSKWEDDAQNPHRDEQR